MTPVPFSALHNLVLPYLPGAEPGIIDAHARKVARDFLKRTTLLREEFEFTTVPGVSTYALTPTFGQVSAVMAVWLDGHANPLAVATEERRAAVASGSPRAWWTMVPHLFSLWPTPDAEHHVRVNAALSLRLDDTTIPQHILDHHAEAIAAGILSMMYAMPGKPWTQRQSAESAGRQYSGAVRTARATAREGGQPNHSTFTAARPFGC